MRIAMGGLSVPLPAIDCYNYYDRKYMGNNFLVGVESKAGYIKGCFFVDDFDTRSRRCQLHFAFDPGYIRAKQAGSAMADYLFKELNIKQVHGIICETNEPAIQVVGRMGWKSIGRLPEYFHTIYGWKTGYHYYLEDNFRRF